LERPQQLRQARSHSCTLPDRSEKRTRAVHPIREHGRAGFMVSPALSAGGTR